MITEPTERILDGIIRAEMFPDSVFDKDMSNMYQYDSEFVPEPSNIVSRKLPMYAAFNGPPMMHDMEPPMHIEEYPPVMDNTPRGFMDEGPNFMPGLIDMHGENCDHHHNFLSLENSPMPNSYSDFLRFQMTDPLFINEVAEPPMQMRNDIFSSPVPQIFSASSAGPLSTFFKNLLTNPNTESDTVKSQVLTTFSFGTPEIINVANEGIIADVPVEITDSQSGNLEGEIDVIVAEKVEPDAPEEEEEEAPMDEIERNFIKTILPDNTFVTTEVDSDKTDNEETVEDNESSEESDIPVEEVEVNIVKTILPDDSYLVSEAGGENEQFQDDVISMIQNTETSASENKPKAQRQIFISRYLETPDSQ